MSKIQYASTSPYALTSQTSWYIKNWQYRAVLPDSGDTVIALDKKYEYRPDKLSQDLYGTPAYYWVFAVRNAWLRSDPIWAFTQGSTIIVPSGDYVRRVVGS